MCHLLGDEIKHVQGPTAEMNTVLVENHTNIMIPLGSENVKVADDQYQLNDEEVAPVLITGVISVRAPSEPCPQTARRRVRTTQNTDRELEAKIRQMMLTKTLPKKRYLVQIREFIKQKQAKAAATNDVIALEDSQKQKQMLDSLIQANERRKAALTKRKAWLRRASTARANYENTAKMWSERIEQCEQELKEKLNALEEEHAREMDQFEKNWADPVYLEPFNKPSARLMMLRQNEQKHAMARDFESAAELKRQADALQAEETQNARMRAVAAMKLQLASIEMRQERELACVRDYCRKKLDRVTQQRDLQLTSLQKAITNITSNVTYRRLPRTSSGARASVTVSRRERQL